MDRTLKLWRRGWDSNSRKTLLSHVIRRYEITVSKALTGITQNHQAGCGQRVGRGHPRAGLMTWHNRSSRQQSPSVYASVFSGAVLFGEVDAAQQTLEAGVEAKWIESRIHFQVAQKRRAFAIGLFESCEGPFVLAQAQINQRELVRRHKLCF